MLNLDLAFCIADEMGIEYPKDRKSGTPYVLTTDFMLIVRQNEKSVQIALTVKLAKDLEKTRVLEKLELEKRYWNRQNINWGIITEQEISKVFADNVRWVHPTYKWELAEETKKDCWYYLNDILKSRLAEGKTTISTITTALDCEEGFESGTFLSLFKTFSSSPVSIIKKVV